MATPLLPDSSSPANTAVGELLSTLAAAWVADGAAAGYGLLEAGEVLPLAGVIDPDGPMTERVLDMPGGEMTVLISGAKPGGGHRLDAEAALLSHAIRREHAVAQMAAALVDADDQSVALYDLAHAETAGLDVATVMLGLAADARRILGAAAVVVAVADGAIELERVVDGDERAGEQGGRALDAIEGDGLLRGRAGEAGDVVVIRFSRSTDLSMAVVSRADRRATTPWRQLARAVAAHGSDRVDVAVLHARAVEQAVIQRDVEVAARLAAQSMPTAPPQVDGLDVAGRSDPARLAGGDFFTYVEVADGLVFAVGDVSGKGLGAALVMTTMTSAVHAAALRTQGHDPAEILVAVSTETAAHLSDTGMFVTVVIGHWSPASKQLRLANAGHSPVVFLPAAAEPVEIPADHPPVGVLPIETAVARTLEFGDGDRLAMGSDGLVEESGVDGTQLGSAALAAQLRAGPAGESAMETVERCFAYLEEYACSAEPADDRTLLMVRAVPR